MMESGNRNDTKDPGLCLLVASCDRYADLWPAFFALFRKYWSDCPYPLFLGSNHAASTDPAVTTLKIGDDRGWGKGLLAMLERMRQYRQSAYVLLLLEDFFLRKPVDTKFVSSCLETLEALKGNCLRLAPAPPPDLDVAGYNFLGAISPGEPYRVSLQASIWRVDALREIIRPGESAWEFEILGSKRSDRLAGFYCSRRFALRYHNAVVRGKWTPDAVDFLAQEGIATDAGARGITEPANGLLPKVRDIARIPWRWVPLKYRLWISVKVKPRLSGRRYP